MPTKKVFDEIVRLLVAPFKFVWRILLWLLTAFNSSFMNFFRSFATSFKKLWRGLCWLAKKVWKSLPWITVRIWRALSWLVKKTKRLVVDHIVAVIVLVVLLGLVWAVMSAYRFVSSETPDWAIKAIAYCICIIPVLCSIYYARKMYKLSKKSNGVKTGDQQPEAKKKEVVEQPSYFVKGWWKWPLAVLICEGIIAAKFPEQYWSLVDIWFVIAHLVAVVAFMFYREPDKKSKDKDEKKLMMPGKIMLVVSALVLLADFTGFKLTDSANGSSSPTISSVQQTVAKAANSVNNTLNPLSDGLPVENAKVEKEVSEFWQTASIDAAGREKMMNIARQTKFNEYESDGKTPLARDLRGRKKIGVQRIDLILWTMVAEKSEIGTVHGNLTAALKLYQAFGDLPWSPYLTYNSRFVEVPANGWSEEIKTNFQGHLQPSANMEVIDNHGRKYITRIVGDEAILVKDGKVLSQFPGDIEWIKYHSLQPDKSELVLVTPQR